MICINLFKGIIRYRAYRLTVYNYVLDYVLVIRLDSDSQVITLLDVDIAIRGYGCTVCLIDGDFEVAARCRSYCSTAAGSTATTGTATAAGTAARCTAALITRVGFGPVIGIVVISDMEI